MKQPFRFTRYIMLPLYLPLGLSASAGAFGKGLIVPGHCVGMVKVHTRIENVEKLIGEAQQGDHGMGMYHDIWVSPRKRPGGGEPYKISTYSLRDPSDYSVVCQIRIESPWFGTTGGVSTDMTLAQIQRRHKAPCMIGPLRPRPKDGCNTQGAVIEMYDDVRHGIAFEIVRRPGRAAAFGRCQAIIVNEAHREAILLDGDNPGWSSTQAGQ